MTSSQRYRPNTPHVIYENIDNEVVLVNLTKGHYFSMQGTAADLWEGVANQASLEEILEILQRRYQGNKQEIQTSIASFIEELVEAELIVSSPEDAVVLQGTFAKDGGSNRLPFRAPELESYKDMEDLLLLDPIHEVDESGWPNKHTIDPDPDA